MQVTLDDKQTAEIKTLVFSIVKDGIQQVTNTRPYLNRKDIAKYFGVAESTIGYWAKLGMPVAVIGGRKLYGKQSITQWLKDHEMPSQKPKHQTKKLSTIGVVKSSK
ncbi:DNA-binding protein [Lactobacillus helveticus]|uniref:terminase small subunit n=1 Tax=Lactobacillus helveticus TaxID=1587 RepID=UPI001C64D402|nr:terminase small subunit [Lactobacillus helveticus]MBW8038060.1 DNA-binding protein [Lactobacillus helveticus]